MNAKLLLPESEEFLARQCPPFEGWIVFACNGKTKEWAFRCWKKTEDEARQHVEGLAAKHWAACIFHCRHDPKKEGA